MDKECECVYTLTLTMSVYGLDNYEEQVKAFY